MPENLNPEALNKAALAMCHYVVANPEMGRGIRPVYHQYQSAKAAVSAYFAALPSPRPSTMINTVEELDKLPVGAVVLDDIDDVMRYLPDGEGGHHWQRLGDEFFYSADEVDLPASVLWVPTEGGRE